MINYLHIQNIGIIDDLTVEFYDGFNVLTGETGAGKTLIIDSLECISGGKFSKDKISHDKEYSLVEANISLKNKDDEYEEHVIYRKVSKNGKTICKIDDRLVPLKVLKDYMENVIDIHGQSENENILNFDAQRELVDNYAKKKGKEIVEDYKKYNEIYTKYEENVHEIKKLKELGQNNLREIDMLKFQIKEIEDAKISIEEEEELEERYEELKNSEDISNDFNELKYLIEEVNPMLDQAISKVNDISKYKKSFEEYKKVIENSYYELEEISISLNKEERYIEEYSEEELAKIELRIDTYNLLKQKYGNTVEKILSFLNDAKSQLNSIENKDERIAELEILIKENEMELKSIGEKLYSYRSNASLEIKSLINEELKDLEMKSALFNIILEKDSINKNGIDKIYFAIKTNKGDVEKELSKIASGGEMSRIMLAIKKILADVDNTPILVFDEIDTGISGHVGMKVGKKMESIGRYHQVLCVTHLPTIAALGDTNYYINKYEENDKTKTSIKKLDEEEVIKEISRIASGNTKESSLINARELRKEKNK